MKLCVTHWESLKLALLNRGLESLIPADTATMTETSFSEQQEMLSEGDYNPLLAANIAIWRNAMTNFGLETFIIPEFCPICFIQTHNQQCTMCDINPDWINLAANEQFDIVKNQNLITIN